MAAGLDRNFRKLWAALSVSLFGSEITLLALPLYAAISLHADALQMGVLASVGQLPYLLCSVPAGIVADRMRRRRGQPVGISLTRKKREQSLSARQIDSHRLATCRRT